MNPSCGMKNFGYAGILLLAMLMSGCAIGNTYKIADTEADVQAIGNHTSVAVASLDKRKNIVDKSSPVTYVGMVRGGYGNPFDATTESNLPFADAVSKAICTSLNRKGFVATPVSVNFEKNESEAFEVLVGKNMTRSIMVTIRQWESDSFYNLNIGYDFVLKVLDHTGMVLATTESKDKVAISGSVMAGSLSLSKTEVPATFQKAIENLLNNPDVVAALSGR